MNGWERGLVGIMLDKGFEKKSGYSPLVDEVSAVPFLGIGTILLVCLGKPG